MATTYGQKRRRYSNALLTVVAVVLICSVFLTMISFLYKDAETEAYEMLHLQTKQIKDDITLQMISDRENLITMANFASKLYSNGDNYDLMFEAFKPIGLFANIGILTPDNVFITKTTSENLTGKISFEREAERGQFISGRIPSLTMKGKEVVRSSVPIKVNGETVGILYGIIDLETLGNKYKQMAQDLDAQLFVYGKDSGKFVIDTINAAPGELSQLKSRKFSKGYSYDALVNSDKGYSSFKSIRNGEDLHLHYSTIEDFNWGIMLARYDSQVFKNVSKITTILFLSFALMILIIMAYLFITLRRERDMAKVNAEASYIRKLLLEINQQHRNVVEALKRIKEFAHARSAFFVDADGEDHHHILPSLRKELLSGDDRKYFVGELFQYAAKLHSATESAFGFMRITPDRHLLKTNPRLYDFLTEHNIKNVSFATITDENNHTSILGTINPKKATVARTLLEEILVCFSIAIYNKKHLNQTELAATTDSLTGALNRVSYNKDILVINDEKPTDFSCVFIDVNELHIMNNKFGHAAGDEMLIYIANSLKGAFFGHSVYRMGGDEFLVFAKNTDPEEIKANIATFMAQLKPKNYNVAIGMSYRKQNINCDELVREAEIRMYEAKAQYYQNKKHDNIAVTDETHYVHTKTGIREIDTMLQVLQEHYNGIYRVSLSNDSAYRILMPSYLGYNEHEDNFSKLLTKYVDEMVHPDYHRPVMNFLNFDAIQRQIAEGNSPKISYKKINGEMVILSVYKLNEEHTDTSDTLWVFAKD